MKCQECESESAEFLGLTDDDRSKIACTACGFFWTHGPSPEDLRAGRTGGSKHHCPVCSHIYSDPATPIVTIGPPNNLAHRCDRTRCFALGERYGLSLTALDKRLAQLNPSDLAAWPRVMEMKAERAGTSV